MATLTVLLTGGAGFVGSAIVDALLNQHPEWRIVVADAKSLEDFLRYREHFGETETAHSINKVPIRHEYLNGDTANGTPRNGEKKILSEVEYIQTDMRQAAEVMRAVEKSDPTFVIHSAGVVPGGIGRYSRSGQDEVFRINVEGTKYLLDACSKWNSSEGSIKGLVHTSSCTVITDDLLHDYPNMSESIPIPATSLPYGESKAAAERLVLASNTPSFLTCALRPSVILGPGDYQLVPSIHACIAKNETPFIIGSGDNLYDFTYVSNVADAHVLAVENLLSKKPTAAGKAIFIQNNEPITFRDFCLAIWAQFRHVPPFEVSIPAGVAWVLGALTEGVTAVFGGRTTLCRGSVGDALGTRYANGKLAKEVLGYEARVSLDEGVRRSCEALQRRLRARPHLTTK